MRTDPIESHQNPVLENWKVSITDCGGCLPVVNDFFSADFFSAKLKEVPTSVWLLQQGRWKVFCIGTAKRKGVRGSSPGKFWNLRWLKSPNFYSCGSTQDTNQSGGHQNTSNCWFTLNFFLIHVIGCVCFVKWRMWSKYFRPLLGSAQTAEDDGHSLGQRHCRAGWCLEDLSSLCVRSGSSDGSVFVASWSGTCFLFYFIFFSEIIGPPAAEPAGSAPAPLFSWYFLVWLLAVFCRFGLPQFGVCTLVAMLSKSLFNM